MSVCSLINFSVVWNKCSTDFEDSFLTDRKFNESSRPRWTAAWSVTDMKKTPNWWVHIEVFQIIRRFPIINLSYDREDFHRVRHTVWWFLEMMWPNSIFEFWIFRIFWTSLECSYYKFPNANDWFLLTIQRLLILARCHKFPCADEQLSISLPTLRTRRYVGPGFSDNPTFRLEALSIPGLLNAIGLSTDEELVATELVRFITIGLDLATIQFSLNVLASFRHPFSDAAKQAEVLGAANWEDYSICERRVIGQKASFGGVPVGYCPNEVHTEEEGVQVKVQAEEEIGETHGREQGEEKGENKRSSRTHGWLCGWDEACTTTWAMQCDVHQSTRVHCMKNDVWSVLFTPPVGCSRLLSAVNETYCNKQFFKMNWTHELHQLVDVSQFHHEELEEEGCHLWYCWKVTGSARSSPDSRRKRFMIVTAARKSDRSRIGAFLPDLFHVRCQCFVYLRYSSLDGR